MSCPCSGGQTASQRHQFLSQRIQQENAKDHAGKQKVTKLLLLGPGESGKSTIFKQAKSLFASGYLTKEQRIGMTSVIYNNLFLGLKTLIKESRNLAASDEAFRSVEDEAAKELEAIDYNDTLDKTNKEILQTVWNDPGIQYAFAHRSQFQLPYPVDYFMKRIDDMSRDDYVPTVQDVIWSRARTTGIVELQFDMFENQFLIIDVGGQRNERKKWIHCFDNVTAVIFVAAISEYDEYLYEDRTTLRMHESLALFKEIANAEWFKSMSLVLFLNKVDIFEEKIKTKNIDVCFPEYKGPMEKDTAARYVQEQFEAAAGDRAFYTHLTCATDPNSMKNVFRSVRDIVIDKQMRHVDTVL